ncbi:hypothetical protein LSUE1_G009197 [Lachnellula suecica]|uniref:Uncharacterized protein n=1 Tax=Lachnellula suecica TaxID=602035 RepID=A0A8T9BRL2_9HELO|nr:hypothetical protein LSUE1_G009197 [Lachnellula suecica]
MRNRRQRLGTTSDILQNNAQLQAWGSSSQASIIGIRASFSNKSEARDFCINLIEIIRSAGIPVIWTLNVKTAKNTKELLVIEVMKQLVLQTLQLNETLRTERSITLSAHRFQSATTEQEWFHLLGASLAGIPRIYIIIDVEVLGKKEDGEEVCWLGAFANLFEEMAKRAIYTIVTVALVSYGSTLTSATPSPYNHGIIDIPRKKEVSVGSDKEKTAPRGSPASVLNTKPEQHHLNIGC